jgi:hypothetical protein
MVKPPETLALSGCRTLFPCIKLLGAIRTPKNQSQKRGKIENRKVPVLRKTMKLFRLGLRPWPDGPTVGIFDFPAKGKTLGHRPKPRTRREAAGGGKSTPHQQPEA